MTAEIHYSSDPEAVFAMLTDQAFQERKLSSTGALSFTVSVSVAGGGAVITSTRSMPTDRVPDAFRSLVGSSLTISQTETWGAPSTSDGSRSGTLSVSIEGAPVKLQAALSLSAVASGSLERVDGELKARVPLIGGRIEKAVEPAVRAAIEAEERIGEEWLAH